MAVDSPVLAGSAVGRDRSAVSERKVPVSARRRRYLTEPTPWRRVHLMRALILVLVGAVVAFVCWWNIAGKVTLEAQQGWFVGSCAGAAVAALGGVYWLLINLREVRIGQRQLVADIAAVMDWPLTRDGRVRRGSVVEDASDTEHAHLVTGPGMTLVHRADCPAARGKAVTEITAADAQSLDDCGICLPSGGPR